MSTSSSKRITLLSLNNNDEATFTTVGMQMYADMTVKLISAKPQSQDAALFREALSRAHTAKYRIAEGAEVVKDPLSGTTITSGTISVRFTLKGSSTYEKYLELNPNCGDLKLSMNFHPSTEEKDLFEAATPVCLYMRNLLRCQITFRCDMKITGYGNDELLISDR